MACSFLNLLPRDGTNQLDRLLAAMQADYVAIEERTPAEWFAFAQTMAGEINYYNQQNIIEGDWVAFFQSHLDRFDQWLQEAEEQSDLPSHLALFISFLRLLEVVKKDLNTLTYRHLDFYYHDILGFKKKGPIADAVHLVFELANNADQHLLKEGTLLKAGKDASKKEQLYEIEKDVVLNSAKVNSLRTVLVDEANQFRVYKAPIANSLDGLGKDEGKEGVYWSTFGESQADLFPEDRTMVTAEIGFAISSPILWLREGDRLISITITVNSFRINSGHIDSLSSLSLEWKNALVDLLGKDYQEETRFRAALIEQLRPLQGTLTDSQFNTKISQIVVEVKNNPLRSIENNEMRALFEVSATCEEGWIELGTINVKKNNENNFTLEMEVSIPAGTEAITPYKEEKHQASLQTAFPTLKFVLNHRNEQFLYDRLRGLKLLQTVVKVQVGQLEGQGLERVVGGVQDLILQNDQSLLDTGGNIQPFGSSPVLGSSFYIGNAEVFSKQLTDLKFSWEWQGLPNTDDGFETYYSFQGYFDPIVTNASFTAKLRWLEQGRWVSGPGPSIKLFNDDNRRAQPLQTISLDSNLPYPDTRNYELGPFEELSSNLKRGFLRFDLDNEDFGHQVFPSLYSEAIIAYNESDGLPNPPYTASLKSIHLYYESEVVIDHLASEYHPEAFFHIETFGARQTGPETSNYLLPQYAPGTLYIGLEELAPPQNLSLLFQVLEGSGDPDFEATREDVQWSLLSGNQWLPLSSLDILEDTTLGLQTSGIIGYGIFREASTHHTLLPQEQYWLRATLNSNPAGVPKMVAIQAQAGKAHFKDRVNDPSHYDLPLAANTIRKFTESVGAIKQIQQPYVSFGNRAAETDLAFYTRVSERLRHKQRAITLWDYEHLTLEAFPEVYKVKCINHSRDDVEIQPGKVTVVIIPDLRQKNAIDPLRPRASIALRRRVQDYLSDYLSLFVELEVINPLYEEIQLDFSVRFHDGYDQRYYTHQLNEELIRFLSPWRFIEGVDIVFGGQIYKSIILDFIEERPYVDFVTNFVLLHYRPGIGSECIGGTLIIGPETDIARATSPRSILVSAAQHRIHALAEDELPCPQESLYGGIGNMIIEATNIIG